MVSWCVCGPDVVDGNGVSKGDTYLESHVCVHVVDVDVARVEDV